MGAQGSAQRDGKSQEDAPASASPGELSAEVTPLQEKNGQISSMTSLNGPSKDNALAEVGQPDGGTVAPKEEAPENMDTLPDEVTPQLNGEKLDKESPEANSISSVEVKSTEEKGEDAGEVGFKKIFTIVGLKFTVKKDKSEETDPVKLLTVKDREGEEVSETDEPAKEKEIETEEEDSKTETMETEKEASTSKDAEKAETTDGASAEASIEGAKAEEAEKESETPPTPKETISPFRKLFFVGLFSNLRKKSSLKRLKEAEEAAKANETTEVKEENDVKEEITKEENTESEQEVKNEASATPVEEQPEPKEETTTPPKEENSDTATEAPAEIPSPREATDESKQEEQKAEAAAKDDTAPADVTSETELQSSQEKTKLHGSPLKKLFTGSGLKKLSTKRQKSKKDTDSGEKSGEQLQSSTESEGSPKAESGPSSPESSAPGEPVNVTEGNQNESSQETEGEVVSDGEKKKESVIASFRKLVTPKKHAKRLSDSEDEATSDKPAKSATMSSSESAPLAEMGDEEDTKEEKAAEEEPKTDNSEKLTTSTEENKKKMDTSVSWEALMCMGGPKKRTRKTSDSDDDEPKAEEEAPAAAAAEEEEGGQEEKNEPVAVTPQETESEEASAPAPEPVSAPPVRESPWATLKRLVASKNKPKVEVKPESSAEQVQPEPEAPKDESAFSLKKLFPGRKKKVAEKQPSPEQEEDSETPAVVPLSEYEDQAPAEQVSPEETADVQNKVLAEDRTPSWIPASVEEADDRRDQLSDITEEAENAATPKSVDTDNTEEDTEDIVPPPNRGNMGRRLSTAEVKPITPAPDASTSPVPKSPERESAVEMLGGIKPQITEALFQTCVTVEDPPVNVATVATEQEPQTETIEPMTKTLLEAHKRCDATAICIGLETKASADHPVEQPVEPTVESAPALKSAQTTELAVEEKSEAVEEATVTEDAVFNAHVHQVQILDLESVAENLVITGSEIQAARESFESEIEKIGVVSIENSEVIQPVILKENSPKATVVDPISPTHESAPCSQSVQVSEVIVETKERHVSTEKLAATGENPPVRAMLQVVADEATSSDKKGSETAVPAVVPSEESAVMMDTVVLVAPEEKAKSSVVVVSKASMSDTFVSAKQIEKVKEEIHRDKEIENRSAEIAQTVIQDAVGKVSEDGPQENNAEKLGSLIPTPVKAIATTEKEVEITTEPVVITDTPSPVLCKKPVKKSPVQLCVATEVTESFPIEVIQALEGEKDVGKEKKLEKRLKKAEIKVSEETVVEEEVGEIQVEIGGKREQSKRGESKDQKPKVIDDVKTQPEEKKAIHMPIQVVLQEAEEVEEPPVEVEIASELNGESPSSNPAAKNPPRLKKLSSLSEEPQVSGSEEAAACSQDTDTTENKPSVKCAEVMAQVIEVIEEAVKEIEPLSTELTAAS